MSDYDFRALSPVDFEHLSRDVLNADLGLRLHSYSPGRDQGVDLRQVDADGKITVVQCKHYPESSPSTFLRAVGKEGERGKSLATDRYIFVTSRPLTPNQQDEILDKLAGLPVVHDDIWGKDELNAALGRHPEVERRHIKLWISSAEVLDTLIRSGQWQRGEALLAALAERARLWVHTPAYDQVLEMLQREGISVISGPPGVGKSFLAEMALLATANSGWHVVHVADNIEDAWGALRSDETPQIFYYDDFLGHAGLELASKNEPGSLNLFLDRIRQLKDSKRIIMTTREQILNQAADGPADQLSDLARQPARFSLRMEAYDLDTRAQIVFNHLYFSNLPAHERDRIAIDNRLISIAEHPSYSPRIVEIGIRLAPHPTADDFLTTISRALDNPRDVWNGSFRGLSGLEQQILLTLATLPRRPWPVDVVRQLVSPDEALAWTPALRKLEMTWLQLTGNAAARSMIFANPGCYDYLMSVLDDTAVATQQLDRVALLTQLVALARSGGLIEPVYRQGLAVARAELASVLTSRREHTLTKVRQFTDADLRKAHNIAARMKTLNDAAALLKALGSAGDTDWLFDLVEGLTEPGADSSPSLPVTEGFALAEAVNGLLADDPARPSHLAQALAIAAAEAISSVRDLDVYEALPDHFKQEPRLQDIVRERARSVIESERDHLLRATSDPEVVESGALDLDQRARWYGIEFDIGPVLDRVDELVRQAASNPDWPDVHDEPDESQDGSQMDLHQIFSRLATEASME
jgi:hypothetical protein